MKKIFITTLVLTIFASVFAQESWNEKMGDRYFEEFSFKEAIVKYEFIKDKTTKVNRNLAEAYFHTGNYAKSEEYYALVVNSNEKTNLDIYQYASVLAINKKYDEADEWMKKYNQATQKKNVKTGFNQSTQHQCQEAKIENLSLNSKHTDFGVTFWGDKFVYTSSNNGVFKKNWRANKLPYLDLYSAELDDNNQLTNQKRFFKEYDSKYHKGPVTFNAEGDFMVFTVNTPPKKRKKKKKSDNEVGLKLYYATLGRSGDWSKPREMPFNGREYSTAQACLSPDGQMIFFASNMPGGEGQVDIYMAKRKSKTSWEKPVNLGKKVNTDGKEMFPFYHPKGILYFASNGRGGFGGLDIYAINVKDGMPIGEAQNVGSPLNSSYDDFGFACNLEQSFGFFASNRPEGKGDDDIYMFTREKPIVKKLITGIAKDNFENIVPNAKVAIYENDKLIDSVYTDDEGEFNFSVNPNKSFTLTGKKQNYKDAKNVVNTNQPNDTVQTELVLNLITELSLLCKVKEKTNGTPLDSVKITMIDNKTKIRLDTLVEKTGKFVRPLEEEYFKDDISFNIKVEREGYVTQEINYEKFLDENGQYLVEIEMYKKEIGLDLAKMENITIYFDYDKFNITKTAAVELDKIVVLMNNNPDMEIELSSHTDCRGWASYNQTLSDNRAKASADYIKQRISNPERIYGKGYGASKPVNDCECDDCTEEQHQENRRTEFKIIQNQDK